MAQKREVVLTCDLHDGELEGAETVSFAVDGTTYDVDVCEEHAAALRDAMAPFVGAGRRAGRAPSLGRAPSVRSGSTPRPAADRERVQRIREWAREHGHAVSERGRLSGAVVEAYEAAHRD